MYLIQMMSENKMRDNFTAPAWLFCFPCWPFTFLKAFTHLLLILPVTFALENVINISELQKKQRIPTLLHQTELQLALYLLLVSQFCHTVVSKMESVSSICKMSFSSTSIRYAHFWVKRQRKSVNLFFFFHSTDLCSDTREFNLITSQVISKQNQDNSFWNFQQQKKKKIPLFADLFLNFICLVEQLLIQVPKKNAVITVNSANKNTVFFTLIKFLSMTQQLQHLL